MIMYEADGCRKDVRQRSLLDQTIVADVDSGHFMLEYRYSIFLSNTMNL